MNEEKIGGMSLDDIMAAAMDGLDDSSNDAHETFSSDKKTAKDYVSTFGDSVSTGGEINTNGGTTLVGGMQTGDENNKGNGSTLVGDISTNGKIDTDYGSKSDVDMPIDNVIGTNNDSSLGYSNVSSKTAVTNKDDVYTIGYMNFPNVKNKLSAEYENKVCEILDYVDNNRTAEAMQLAQDLIDHNMSNEVAWYVYALAKDAWGDKALAQKGFEQAIAINPVFAVAYNDLGILYLENNEYEKAKFYFEKAVDNSPKETLFMGNLILAMSHTDSYDAAIEKCLYFIDISEEKTDLQNILGSIYVDKAWKNTYDIPDAEGGEPDIGFITLEDIKESRELCRKAKALLTLDKYKDQVERCDVCLELCDKDQNTKVRASGISFLMIHAAITFVVCFFLLYTIIGIPCIFIAPWATFVANRFPMYMYNFADYYGYEDPLMYNKRKKIFNGERPKEMRNPDNANLSIFLAYVWVVKTRISWYKRVIDGIKEKKQEKKLNLNHEN